MAEITIGVPVYNGGQLLDGSLACLARQTFRDFKVLIFDNASTDGTEEIARGWAARDARFHYVRQPGNVGGMFNQRDSLLAADTKWFMWRADDDLSDDNYLEELYALATQAPGCKLAVASAVFADWDLTPEHVVEPPALVDPGSIGGRVTALLASCPPWYYGLWDRETLRAALLAMLADFPYPYASDHLTLYGPIIEGAVRATRKTRIIMRVRRAPKAKGQGGRTPFKVMWEIRRGFVRNLRRMRSERALSPAMRLALLAAQPIYVRRRLPSLTKLLRRGVREMFGRSKQGGASWHVQRNS